VPHASQSHPSNRNFAAVCFPSSSTPHPRLSVHRPPACPWCVQANQRQALKAAKRKRHRQRDAEKQLVNRLNPGLGNKYSKQELEAEIKSARNIVQGKETEGRWQEPGGGCELSLRLRGGGGCGGCGAAAAATAPATASLLLISRFAVLVTHAGLGAGKRVKFTKSGSFFSKLQVRSTHDCCSRAVVRTQRTATTLLLHLFRELVCSAAVHSRARRWVGWVSECPSVENDGMKWSGVGK
jgi:hypothetical protein